MIMIMMVMMVIMVEMSMTLMEKPMFMEALADYRTWPCNWWLSIYLPFSGRPIIILKALLMGK